MHTSGHPFSARRHRFLVQLVMLLAALVLTGCAAAQQELAASQAELGQVRDQLAGAQAEVSARQTEVPQLLAQVATAEAQVQAQKAENDGLKGQLTEAQAQIAAKETAVADAQKELAATQKELDEVKFAADRLLTQAEATLAKNDLKAAQRIAALLDEKHPGTSQATRAAEIVAQIETALAEQAAADEARIAAATAKMRTDTDAVREMTFYTDKTTTQYNNYNSFHLYIGQNSSGVWLRLRIQYAADDWLFIENYVIKADDKRFDIAPDYFDIERDNGSGGIWEWYDKPVERSDVKMVQAVIASGTATLRYNGKQYYDDREITAAEKQALQNVLDAFVAMGGDLNNP